MASVRHLGLFPFCVPTLPEVPPGPKDLDGSEGVGTFYPIGVDLKTAMKWYWRVKKWRMKLTIEDAEVDFVLPNHSIIDGEELISAPVNELDLVCERKTSFEKYDGGFDQYGFGLFDTVLIGGGAFSDILPAPVIKVGDLYYPMLEFGGNVVTFAFASWQYSNGEASKGGTATIDGKEFDAYLFPADLPENCTFDLSIEEYWPYDAGNGPIYDKDTGQQLQ